MRGTTFDLGERLSRSASLTVLQSVDWCARDLAAGFTSVRDAGGTPNGVRQAVQMGYFPGPRMKLAISILSETGGSSLGKSPYLLSPSRSAETGLQVTDDGAELA